MPDLVRRPRLWWLILRWLVLITLFRLYLRRRYPYSPFRPAERGGGQAGDIGTVDDAVAFLTHQYESGSTAWHNLCEKLCRSSYQIGAHYSSAEDHGEAVDKAHRYGTEHPSRGDLILMLNGGYGHVVVCDPTTSKPWRGWSNDYGGRGTCTPVDDLRNLVSWCGATSWYVADAWWSPSTWRGTHEPDLPEPPDDPSAIGDDMFLYRTPNGKTAVMVADGKQVGLDAQTANAFMAPIKGPVPTYVQFTADVVARMDAAYGPAIW